jgi:histidinol-phosphate aminotransferase
MNRSFDIGQLVRPNIRELVPYSSARDEFTGSASVFLDANENPHNPPLNRYPDPVQRALKKRLADIKSQSPGNLFLGNGSDEGIDLLIRVLCEPQRDNVVIVEPTYGMYSVCADIHNVERRGVQLRDDFSLDAETVIRRADRFTKLVFLCSPNNPTSNSLDHHEILRLAGQIECMVVVDEAYIDFSSGSGLLNHVPETSNLVVLQTLSKAWGLAGIRLGMVFAHPELVGYLSSVKYPYNINSLTMEHAMVSLSDPGSMNRWVESILLERERLALNLEGFSFVEKVYPSDANFLLVRVIDPGRLYRFLMDRGIIVRNRSSAPLCNGCLRITVGTEEENHSLVNALGDYETNSGI